MSRQRIDLTVHLLLRLYPAQWRERYGDEFAAMLEDDIRDRPRSLRRPADVFLNAVVVRLGVAGLRSGASAGSATPLVTFAMAATVFAACLAALWSQLLIGWQWAPPDTVSVAVSVAVMTATASVLLLIGVLAVVPVAVQVLRCVVTRRVVGLGPMVATVFLGSAALAIGGHHFAAHWPGVGGHPWRFRGYLPRRLAGYGWAETLGVTSYWLHPHALGRFPSSEIAWMAISPLTFALILVQSGRIVRRLPLSERVGAWEVRLASVATVVMIPGLLIAAWWSAAGRRDVSGLFRAGSIDLAVVLAMAVALASARASLRVARVTG